MATANFRYRDTDLKRLHVRGDLSSDGTSITYTDSDGKSQTLTITNIMNQFKGKAVVLTVSEKDDTELSM